MENKGFSHNPFGGLDPADFRQPEKKAPSVRPPAPKTENDELLERFASKSAGRVSEGAAAGMQLRKAQDENDGLRQKCDSLSKARDDAEARTKKEAARAEKFRQDLAAAERKLAEASREIGKSKSAIAANLGKIADLEGRLKRSDEKNDALEKELAAVERAAEAPASALLTRPAGFEEMFDGETLDAIVDVLQAARKDAESGGRARRAEVIASVLAANPATGELARRRKEVRRILENAGKFVDGRTLDALAELGVDCVSGRKHWKLKYGSQTFSIAKTPSDVRGNVNSALDMINRFF